MRKAVGKGLLKGLSVLGEKGSKVKRQKGRPSSGWLPWSKASMANWATQWGQPYPEVEALGEG